MPETLSRMLVAAEVMLIAVPASLVVLSFALPAAFVLTPVALLGLVQTVLAGGPRMGQDLWTGAGVLMMALTGVCAVGAFLVFLALAGRFVLLGRGGLAGCSSLARLAVLLALPPILLSSLPRMVEAWSVSPIDPDRVAAAAVFGGIPLLIPAIHLLLELRASRQTRPAPFAED
ncbi:hypothetical protein [Muricoccus radiodurans]|uniref:hypothetical protein n=1 Tax=Muricoccus radiodurans TaxID=2231721 RepID=UPI003CFACB7D